MKNHLFKTFFGQNETFSCQVFTTFRVKGTINYVFTHSLLFLVHPLRIVVQKDPVSSF